MPRFAVIDTETNWNDQVMSIGIIVADAHSFRPIAAKYYILSPEYRVGGMFSDTLFSDTPVKPILCTRRQALSHMTAWLEKHAVSSLFAYNANFDKKHLPELCGYVWHDIMRLAAYRQHNPTLPPFAEYCRTGRLKRGYGVEPVLRMLSQDCSYHETHNAIFDALDELEIMRLLGHPVSAYPPL